METRAVERLRHIKSSIGHIRELARDSSATALATDAVALAAFERFLEIISEASRHVPEEWKAEQSHIPWRQIAGIGNIIRHTYERTDPKVLWSVYTDDLDPLEQAIDAILLRHSGA